MPNARTNDSTNCRLDLSRIFGSGAFKNVWQGRYTDGPRNGERCVSKEFKEGGKVYEAHYFDKEMRIIEQAQGIIDDFMRARVLSADRRIFLNTPAVWYCPADHSRCLIEPMIERFEKFNSNTGWAARVGTQWSDAIQALSHFSYHNSNRQLLLCDLQGGIYSDGYVLSDPVIVSRDGDNGPADLGIDGINSFFERHRCGAFCRANWLRPILTGRPVIPEQEGTAMVNPAHLPTRRDRNPLSRLRDL